MSKHSKRNRRRMHQAGMGGSFAVVRRVPARLQRHLPDAPTLSAEAHYRLRCLEHAARTSVREASRTFGVPVATIYRWRRRFRPDDLTTLEPRSRRPHRTRRATWTAAQEQAVLALRQEYPRMGKEPLRILLARQGVALSASMIGRILSGLRRRRRLLREPHAVRVRRERPQRPYATRVPKDKRAPTEPGALIQLDTMHLRPLPGVERRQFTAVDVVSRCAVVGVRATASAGTATAFLAELVARMPVPVRAIDPGRRRLGVHGGVRGGLPGPRHRPLRVAAAQPQAQRPGRAAQRHGQARVLGVLRGRPRPARPPSRLAGLGSHLQYGPTPPGPRVPDPRRRPLLPVVLRCIELAQGLD